MRMFANMSLFLRMFAKCESFVVEISKTWVSAFGVAVVISRDQHNFDFRFRCCSCDIFFPFLIFVKSNNGSNDGSSGGSGRCRRI